MTISYKRASKKDNLQKPTGNNGYNTKCAATIKTDNIPGITGPHGKYLRNEKTDKPYSAVHQGVHRGSQRDAEASFITGRVLQADRGEPKKV